MHACGHDGHTAILLSAAHYLAHHGDIDGTLQLVFQPAEETGSGASKMIADGLFERFPVDAIYGLHNWPGVPVGHFGFVDGPAMASVDWARLKVIGGGHGAEPQGSVDPILVAAHIITALQSVVSRNVDPRQMGVVTVGSIHGGPPCDSRRGRTEADRARIPARGARHAAPPGDRDCRADRCRFRARAEIEFPRGFPSVINHRSRPPTSARRCRASVPNRSFPSLRRARPARISPSCCRRDPAASCSSGTASAPLHSPRYVFNDAAIVPAASLWARLAEDSSGEGRGMSSNERFLYTRWMTLARPLFDGLEQEYDSRYADVRRRIGGSAGGCAALPGAGLCGPGGAFVLLLRDGVAISAVRSCRTAIRIPPNSSASGHCPGCVARAARARAAGAGRAAGGKGTGGCS